MKDAKGHGSEKRGGFDETYGLKGGTPVGAPPRLGAKFPPGHPFHTTPGLGAPVMPIPGHAYHTKTNAELNFITKDASAAAKNMQGMGNAKAEGKYLDQVNDASTVLGYRQRGGKDMSQSPAVDVAAQHGIDTSHLVGYVPPSRPGDQSPTHNSQGHEWGSPAALADFKAEHGGPANKGQLARIARFRKAVGRGE